MLSRTGSKVAQRATATRPSVFRTVAFDTVPSPRASLIRLSFGLSTLVTPLWVQTTSAKNCLASSAIDREQQEFGWTDTQPEESCVTDLWSALTGYGGDVAP